MWSLGGDFLFCVNGLCFIVAILVASCEHIFAWSIVCCHSTSMNRIIIKKENKEKNKSFSKS